RPRPTSTLFPSTTLFRSQRPSPGGEVQGGHPLVIPDVQRGPVGDRFLHGPEPALLGRGEQFLACAATIRFAPLAGGRLFLAHARDRKSTRLNSSHDQTSY